jgi:hypothetical protein
MINPFDLKTVFLAKHAQHVVLIHFPIALFITAVALSRSGPSAVAWPTRHTTTCWRRRFPLFPFSLRGSSRGSSNSKDRS